ncbi:MAG: bifunctional UDP-N-acetylglucosamine diphosphorylase/glucosamine-1-phosphate N-acetyltransferase GlmU [Erysipelotrichaceae bacterium]
MNNAIILAAGKGTRMKSEHSKCMQLVGGKPIVKRIVDNLRAAGIENIVMVVGHAKEEIIEYFHNENITFAVQSELLGTGHAVSMASMLKDEKGDTLIINGDVPLLQAETFRHLLEEKKTSDLVLLTAIMHDPALYGRIIRDEQGKFEKIIEAKDCTLEQLSINEINGAIYCVDNEKLFECLPLIKNENRQKEYYLTDIVEIFNDKNYSTKAYVVKDSNEIMGVDHRFAQMEANSYLRDRTNKKHLVNGVIIEDITSVYIDESAVIENGVIIEANTKILGASILKSGCKITSGSVIIDSVVGNDTVIENSKVSDSILGNNTTLGPMSHLRNNCQIGDNCRIGNFVEMKNTTFRDGSKCAHLTYLGDCEVGKRVNFGCGVVTVNYDGKNKFKTVIKDGAFIGSNANLLAPIVIGENALIAAGSTVYHDIEDGDMGIARCRQENKVGYGFKYKNK